MEARVGTQRLGKDKEHAIEGSKERYPSREPLSKSCSDTRQDGKGH